MGPGVVDEGPQTVTRRMSMTIEQLAQRIEAKVRGDTGQVVCRCAGLKEAGPDDVSFVANPKYAKLLATSKAGAVIVSPANAKLAGGRTLLIADHPYFAFRQAVVALHGFRVHAPPIPAGTDGVFIDPSATVGSGCSLYPMSYIAAGATIGDRCVIYPYCFVGPGATIGDDCVLFPNVTIYDGCVLGHRVTLHAGCVIGQDGFGYATHDDCHLKIPQVGNVVIEDDVEMGACCVVDRATVGCTRVGQGSKFSDLVTIGHGATIGPHNLLVAQVAVAGSSQTGSHVVMGGQVGVAGHIKIGDRAQIAAKAGVKDNLPGGAQYGGQPAIPFGQSKRSVVALAKLPEFIQEFRRLQKRVTELESQVPAEVQTRR